jgi:hypothetical protein
MQGVSAKSWNAIPFRQEDIKITCTLYAFFEENCPDDIDSARQAGVIQMD